MVGWAMNGWLLEPLVGWPLTNYGCALPLAPKPASMWVPTPYGRARWVPDPAPPLVQRLMVQALPTLTAWDRCRLLLWDSLGWLETALQALWLLIQLLCYLLQMVLISFLGLLVTLRAMILWLDVMIALLQRLTQYLDAMPGGRRR